MIVEIKKNNHEYNKNKRIKKNKRNVIIIKELNEKRYKYINKYIYTEKNMIITMENKIFSRGQKRHTGNMLKARITDRTSICIPN